MLSHPLTFKDPVDHNQNLHLESGWIYWGYKVLLFASEICGKTREVTAISPRLLKILSERFSVSRLV